MPLPSAASKPYGASELNNEYPSSRLGSLLVYDRSSVKINDINFSLARSEDGGSKYLSIQGYCEGFYQGQPGPSDTSLYPLTTDNASALRARLPWLSPVPLGLQTSAGFGDRLGLATPGHVRAMRRVPGALQQIAPVFAQQSVRENIRTGRSPNEVLDEATWGLFEVGWKDAWGADADHLKTFEAIDDFVAAGYTFFTVDPGDFVDDGAQTAVSSELESKLTALPWETLEDSRRDLEKRYLGVAFDIDQSSERFDREALWRAAAKYGAAIGRTAEMYRRLAVRMGDRPFELEVSVDETEHTTSLAEHFYIASELRRLGVRWVSLAPRFIGRFEKGVDYIGDLDVFSVEFSRHAAVARELGPYKLSLHSGSDKLSVYGIAARHTSSDSADGAQALVHLKTAGTSYLEALRAVAMLEAELFRDILTFSKACFDTDRASYHISAELAAVPKLEDLSDSELPGLLDQFDARQVLHVTFGSVLERFGQRLRTVLRLHEESHYSLLAKHFVRHLTPFVG